jgi:glycosyltransferase involved in cell wall biosynthesis
LAILKSQNALDDIKVNIVGGVHYEADQSYLDTIKELAREKNVDQAIEWHGRVSNRETVNYYNSNDLYINTTQTGSFDKTTLEAMACGTLVLTANRAFREVFPDDLQDLLMYREGNSADLAAKIKNIRAQPAEQRKKSGQALRQIIIDNHSTHLLIPKIIKAYG